MNSPPPSTSTETPWARLTWPRFVVTLGILVVWMTALGGAFDFWRADGAVIIPSLKSGCAIGGALILIGMARARFSLQALNPLPLGASAALLGLFLSDWLTRGYNLLQGPSIRGEIFLGAVITWHLLRSRAFRVIHAAALLAAPFLAWCFLSAADGRLMFSDDHPVFLYRLLALKENFPSIPFFNPLWNGGIDHRDFFATGALNVFLPFWPLIKAFDVVAVYNLIIVGVIFIIGPAATYLAARIEKLERPVPALALLLHLTVSLLWYRWALKYGTMGFVMSASLVPLNISLISLIFSRDRELTPALLALAACSLSFMVCWSLAGVVLLPAILLGVIFIRRVLRKRFVPSLLVLLAAINLPWIALFWEVSNVGSFVKAEKAPAVAAAPADGAGAGVPGAERRTFRHRSREANLKESVKVLRENAISVHPLILLFALPGVFLLRRESRTVILATGGWLFVLGTVCVPLKPQLELDRMLLILALVGAVPAARAIIEVLERGAGAERGIAPRGLAALVGGFLFAGPFAVSGVIHNRSVEHYSFADSTVGDIAAAITNHGGAGRVLFSGFVLHELSSGHLAPLSAMTGKPLIASSHVHDKWRYQQVFPEYFLEKKDEGIERYLDLYNVTAVFAHEPVWRSYFKARPSSYREVWRGGRFVMFERLNSHPSYFLKGSGEITAQVSSGVRFKLAEPEATLKFNYFPFVQVEGCETSGAAIEGGAVFVHLSGCPTGAELTLKSVPPLTRLLHHE